MKRTDTDTSLRPVVTALAAASVLCAAMVGSRMVYTGEWTYWWLIVPNLLLAWIPLIAARLACRSIEARGRVGAGAVVWGIVWLAFYPNASYITTDLVHLTWASTESTLYYDLIMTLFTGMVGLLLGALSLLWLHAQVNRLYSRRAGGLFAAAIVLLGSVGVYLGRFLRWNSWDLAVRPLQVLADAAEIVRKPEAVVFIVSFALCTGAFYAVIFRIARS